MPLIGRRMMGRPLLRGAMVAGTGYAVGRANANRRAHEEEQEERIQSLESQAYQAPAQQYAAPQAPEASISVKAEELTKLKQLLDAGILTQEEFDGQKQQILQG